MKTQNEWNDLAQEVADFINKDPILKTQTTLIFNIRNRILFLHWKNKRWLFNWIDPMQLPVEFIVNLKELGYNV